MVANPNVVRRWTYEVYFRLDDDRRYEIIEGELRDKTPAPSVTHQWCSRNLEFLLLEHVREEVLGLEEGRYGSVCFASGSGSVTSSVLKALEVDVASIFSREM